MPSKPPSSRVTRTAAVQAERDRRIPRPSPESGLRVASPNEWLPIWREVKAKPPIKVVGYALLEYADYGDGADIRPGEPLLALKTDQSERTVGKALAQMRAWGLIWRYVEGSSQGRRQLADEYRFTIPDDLMTRVPLITTVARLPDHPNDVPVITPDHPNEIRVIEPDQANDVRVISAEHPNFATGSPEPRDTDHPNEVRPTFISDLSMTSPSPGVLHSVPDVEVSPGDVADEDAIDIGAGGQDRRGCQYSQCRVPSSPIEAGRDYHDACERFAQIKARTVRATTPDGSHAA
jgi:hypothetical protein